MGGTTVYNKPFQCYGGPRVNNIISSSLMKIKFLRSKCLYYMNQISEMCHEPIKSLVKDFMIVIGKSSGDNPHFLIICGNT